MDTSIFKTILLLALVVSVPLTIHIAIISGHFTPALLILLLAFTLIVIRTWKARITFGLMLAFIVVLLSSAIGIPKQFQLYAIPVLINVGLAVIFGLSLLPNKTPIITKYAILLRDEVEQRVVIYTRQVTQLWTIFFVLLAIESLLLAIFAPLETWSLFANLLNYVFTALVFIGEYYFRINHLNDLEHMSFPRFIHSLSKVSFSDLRK